MVSPAKYGNWLDKIMAGMAPSWGKANKGAADLTEEGDSMMAIVTCTPSKYLEKWYIHVYPI